MVFFAARLAMSENIPIVQNTTRKDDMRHFRLLTLSLPLALSACATSNQPKQDCSIVPKNILERLGSAAHYTSYKAIATKPNNLTEFNKVELSTQALESDSLTPFTERFFLEARAMANLAMGNDELAQRDYLKLAKLPNIKPARKASFARKAKELDASSRNTTEAQSQDIVDAKPLIRVPPIMPSAFINKDNSGHCALRFDVDELGKVVNAEAEYCTHDALEAPSLKSVRKWQYMPKLVKGSAVLRSDVRTQITFNVQDQCGYLFPE